MRTMRKRRRQNRTDYKARIALLKSEKPRVVVRKTNRYILSQLISSDLAQDKVSIGANSKELLLFGWPKDKEGALKSLPASYLTGFLLGKKVSLNCKHAVLDIGLHRNVPKSRIYSFLKGILDYGVSIPHNKDILPSDEQIRKDTEIGKLIDSIKNKIKGGK